MANREDARATLAAGAEMLAAHQLDLLAQIEGQLRAVRQTMQRIEALRGSKAFGAAVPTDAYRGLLLSGLSDEIDAIDSQLTLEHHSCREMLETVHVMLETLADIKHAAAIIRSESDSATP